VNTPPKSQITASIIYISDAVAHHHSQRTGLLQAFERSCYAPAHS